MSIISIVLIALGLSMDAFAVSMSNGCIMVKLKIKMALRISLFFGLFQAIMPIIGYLSTSAFKVYIEKFDHWIAFGILSLIGVKMLIEAFAIEKVENKKPDYESLVILLGLAIATSIDALAVGITFSLLGANIFVSSFIIGVITFILSFLGVFFGCKFGTIFKKKVEIVGAITLILIGLKILIEHLLLENR